MFVDGGLSFSHWEASPVGIDSRQCGSFIRGPAILQKMCVGWRQTLSSGERPVWCVYLRYGVVREANVDGGWWR